MLVPGFAVVALDDGLHTDEGFLEFLDFFQLEVGILHHLIDDRAGAVLVDGQVGDLPVPTDQVGRLPVDVQHRQRLVAFERVQTPTESINFITLKNHSLSASLIRFSESFQEFFDLLYFLPSFLGNSKRKRKKEVESTEGKGNLGDKNTRVRFFPIII